MSAMEGGGGGTLSEIYHCAKRLLLRTRDELEKLERLEYTAASGMDSPDLSSSIKRDITQIQSLCVEMDRLWRSVAAKSQRDLWKRKVEQIAEEADSMKQSLDKYFLRNQKRMMEAKERADLVGRANGDSAHILRIFDDEAQAMSSVRNSSRMLEEASATGEAILFKYSEQRDRLKILSSLGFCFRASPQAFKTRLLGRSFHTLIKNVLFPSPTDVGFHNPPPFRAQRPCWYTAWYPPTSGLSVLAGTPPNILL